MRKIIVLLLIAFLSILGLSEPKLEMTTYYLILIGVVIVAMVVILGR